MKNWRTTVGGAVSTVGKGMIMMGVLPQLAGSHSNLLWWMTLVGYVINIVGEGLAKFFAADAVALKEVVQRTEEIAQQTNVNTVKIGDTNKKMDAELKK